MTSQQQPTFQTPRSWFVNIILHKQEQELIPGLKQGKYSGSLKLLAVPKNTQMQDMSKAWVTKKQRSPTNRIRNNGSIKNNNDNNALLLNMRSMSLYWMKRWWIKLFSFSRLQIDPCRRDEWKQKIPLWITIIAIIPATLGGKSQRELKLVRSRSTGTLFWNNVLSPLIAFINYKVENCNIMVEKVDRHQHDQVIKVKGWDRKIPGWMRQRRHNEVVSQLH